MTDRTRLTESIRNVGLIHPIILRSMESDRHFQIVSGFLRVKSCIDVPMKEIDSIVYRHDELSDIKALLLSLHQTATSRNLNLIEKSLALGKLSEVSRMKKAEIMNDIMPLLHLEPSETILHNVVHLGKLTDEVKASIVQNDVTLGNALLFSEFSKEDQKDLLKLLSPLKPGTNRLKELLTTIDEIRHRDELPVREIIDSEMKTALANQNMPTPQKTEYIRKRLKEKRFPKLTSLEGTIQKNLRQLKLPPEISLSTPPFLEGDRLKVEFSFKNVEELKKIINKLSDVSNQKELKVLLKML